MRGERGASGVLVAVLGVTGEPLAVPAVPLPALLRGMGRVFVGRERELGELEQQWKEASAGELRLAFVAGEPGVGKTRLAGEIAARLHARGATVLAGSCGEDLGVPYQPFVEALRHQVDHTPGDELGGCLGRYPGEHAAIDEAMAGNLCRCGTYFRIRSAIKNVVADRAAGR